MQTKNNGKKAVEKKATAKKGTKKTVKAGGVTVEVHVPAPTPKEEKPKRETISQTARALILSGKTNEEVLAELVKRHQVDPETKKHYPGWYRAQLVREGKLTKKDAAATRH